MIFLQKLFAFRKNPKTMIRGAILSLIVFSIDGIFMPKYIALVFALGAFLFSSYMLSRGGESELARKDNEDIKHTTTEPILVFSSESEVMNLLEQEKEVH